MTDQLRSTAGPRAGALYRLPFGGEGIVGWALLKSHPDDPHSFLCVPADLETALVTDDDVIVEDAGEALVLRGNHSLWLRDDDFWEPVAHLHVPRAARVRALERLRCIAGLTEQAASSATPDFDECLSDWWTTAILPAVAAATRWRNRRVVRCGTREHALEQPTPLSAADAARSTAFRLPLAASGRGAFHAAWDAARRLVPRSISVDGNEEFAAWTFWVDAAGVQPRYVGAGDPPFVWALPAGERRRRLDWEIDDAGCWSRQSIAWGAGNVRFALDGEVALELVLDGEEGEFAVTTDAALEDARARANPGEFLDCMGRGLIDQGFPASQIDLRVRAAARVLSASTLELAPRDRLAYGALVGERARVGVIGLVVDPHSDPPIGLVTRLRAQPADSWAVDPELPFDSQRLADLLVRLHHASGVQIDDALPERLAFELRCERVGPIAGPSMDVAALLALIDGLDGHRHPLLRAACSVVQERERGGDDAQLVAVEHYVEKLEAFRREIGDGSLLVCPTAIADVHTTGFAAVWRVDRWSDLARGLESAGLLDVLLQSHELTDAEHARVSERLRNLCFGEQRYREARDLAQRLARCAVSVRVPVVSRWTALQRCTDPARLLGLAEEALEDNQRLVNEIRAAGSIASHEQLADAENHLASALFEAHRFDASHALLLPWIKRIESDAGMLSSALRARLYTVAARAASVLCIDDAAIWMQRAVDLQTQAKDPYLSRTLGHAIEVLLRLGRDADAEHALNAAWRLQNCAKALRDHADWFLAMYRAELARRLGTQWSDDRLEDATLIEGGQSSWALAGYQQAVARQAGRSAAERIARLRAAASLARRGSVTGSLFELLGRLLAHCADVLEGSAASHAELDAALRGPAGVWYRDALAHLDATRDFAAVDALLTRVPHFAGPCRT